MLLQQSAPHPEFQLHIAERPTTPLVEEAHAKHGWCYSTNGGSQYCFPECSTDADCSLYPGAVCELYETVDGYNVWTCG